MKTIVKKEILGTALAMMTLGFLNTSFAAPHGHAHPKANKHTYYYYPMHNIYFAPEEQTYYVWNNHDRKWGCSSWGQTIYYSQISLFPHVTLQMESEHPYYYNEVHRHDHREPLLVAEVPIRPARVVVSTPAPVTKPRVQVNIEFRPVHIEREPVYVVHDHHHHPGRGHAYGHYKGNGHHKGHGHH